MSTVTDSRVAEQPGLPPELRAARRRKVRRQRLAPVFYIGPAFLAIAAIIGYPVVNAIGTSFLDASLLRPGQDTFAGLDNYLALFGDPQFLLVLGRTVVWAASALVVQLGLGLLIANTLNKKLRARGAIRTTLIIPWIVPTVLVALIWRFLLDPVTGPINELLRSSGLLENPPVWLADTRFVLPILVLISAWKWTPFGAVILLAGMQQIPQEQHEAAMVDGANAWQRFRNVTVPAIRTSIALVTLTTISGAINNFNGIWLFTRGGPAGATEILTTLAYRTAFTQFDFGKASAISVVIFAMMMVIAVIYFYVVEGRKGGPR